jgi:hypothetical protein
LDLSSAHPQGARVVFVSYGSFAHETLALVVPVAPTKYDVALP